MESSEWKINASAENKRVLCFELAIRENEAIISQWADITIYIYNVKSHHTQGISSIPTST